MKRPAPGAAGAKPAGAPGSMRTKLAAAPGEVRIIGGQWKRTRLPVAQRPGFHKSKSLVHFRGGDVAEIHIHHAVEAAGGVEAEGEVGGLA